jgi:hypothetical protein
VIANEGGGMKYTVIIFKDWDDEGIKIENTNGITVSDGVIKVWTQGVKSEFQCFSFPANRFCARVYQELPESYKNKDTKLGAFMSESGLSRQDILELLH